MTFPDHAPQPAQQHTDTALAYWTVGPCQGELRSEELPAPAQGEALVRALYSGISRGTELVVHEAHVPPTGCEEDAIPPSNRRFSGPVKFGYLSDWHR